MGQERLAAAISQTCGLPELIGRLLHARGITAEGAAHFLEPTLRALLPDPSCLTDMDAAAERLADAVAGGETVGIFGDYDVDGACATGLLAGLLRELGCAVLTHVPDRMLEGYGPNAPALLAMVERGAGLIVCVDCGTAAPEPLIAVVGRADVVILDHHKAEGPPPPVLATVNPNRLDCASGLGTLCATAIAFLAAVAMVRALRRRGWFGARREPDLISRLDMVALATICDVMPLTGLNRALVTQGLKVMGRRERIGLKALLEVAMAHEAPSAFTCGYAIGPRINAGGRIAEADLGLRLLLCEDADEARGLAERLDAVNRQRRGVEAAILDHAMELAAAQVAAGHAVLLLSGTGWHPGVVGIVAGRVKERFNRPALVGAELEDGSVKGSGRSVPGLDLGTVIIAARQSGLLLTGGGHAMAAGFSLRADGIAALHGFLDERLAAARHRPAAVDLPVDAVLGVAGANAELAAHVGRLAPFGPGNDEPVFVLPNVRVARADRIGKEGNTLRLLVEGEGGGPRLKALLFRAGEGALAPMLESRDGARLHLAGQLRAEAWQGRVEAGFFIADAALALGNAHLS
ncbi:single-stranded-DNA-specific exonuclease RecJ [Lichenicoccus roseus]|uniref:Single-stranded-DNA-specific exonuclease RecJ n=1 Tax=Lichenicoccus roseus TaxID=2683649 RepID=A0A5R9JBG3_9PROT|nr:single-stranded-DNA-specific exonuclease RecJ [Lichenicoccus roseus]TLU71598.1 single-stranded-DNA-specific exonuclease RecJ [Lichenicoccus roseus]